MILKRAAVLAVAFCCSCGSSGGHWQGAPSDLLLLGDGGSPSDLAGSIGTDLAGSPDLAMAGDLSMVVPDDLAMVSDLADPCAKVNCNPWETCAFGICSLNPSSRWDVFAVHGTVAPVNGNGNPWDNNVAPFDKPDPMVCLTIAAVKGCSSIVQDSYAPVWGTKLAAAAKASDLLSAFPFEYVDSDLIGSEVICKGITAINASSIGVVQPITSCTLGSFTIKLSYAP